MEIKKIDVIPFRIPMKEAIKFATGYLDAVEHVLVRIHTDEDLIGIAEAPSRPMIYGESVQSIVTAIQIWFEPLIIGLDPFAVEKLWSKLQTVEHNPTAKAAIDMAIHDIIGQAAGVPCYKLLGGWGNEIDLSYILGLNEPEAVAEQAVQVIDDYGFKTLKLKAGLEPKRDTAMLKSVREAVGPDIRLCIDVNHGYDSITAAQTLPQWEPYNVAWVEEPCPGWDRRGRKIVAKATSIPIMADESCITPQEVMDEIWRGDCRLMSIKNARTGYYLSTKIIHLCEEAGVAPLGGSQGDTDIGTITSAHFCAAHRSMARWPSEVSFFLEISDHLLTERPEIKDGKIKVTDRPGMGVQIDEGKLKHYRMDL